MSTKRKKIYHSFKSKDGIEFRFDTYMEFSEWYFNTRHVVLLNNFDEVTRKKLQRAATQSKEAKTPA